MFLQFKDEEHYCRLINYISGWFEFDPQSADEARKLYSNTKSKIVPFSIDSWFHSGKIEKKHQILKKNWMTWNYFYNFSWGVWNSCWKFQFISLPRRQLHQIPTFILKYTGQINFIHFWSYLLKCKMDLMWNNFLFEIQFPV